MSELVPRSQAAFAQARALMPGGVNSPARACGSVGADPVFIKSAQGAWVTDIDGNRYRDFVGAFGPMILGHGHPRVREAVRAQIDLGFSFGTPTEGESELARRITELVPSMEKLRLVSSGTEATMSAIRTARGYTGRPGIIKFDGGYHGHADALLVKAGSGAMTLGTPDSAGVTAGATRDTLLARFNDLDSVRKIFQDQPQGIAAIIVEPVAGNMGVVPPAQGFLEGLRQITADHGALLIFDEVMTGFRVHPGGAQALFGIAPDLTCLGKIVGGGLPVGVYGGSREIMACVAPEGPVYQAGTNSGNPLSVAAGLATLDVLSTERADIYGRLEEMTASLERGLTAGLAEAGVAGVVQRVGSMLTLFFTSGPVRCVECVTPEATKRFGAFWRLMRAGGVMLPPSQYEAWFVSAAHDIELIEEAVSIAREALLRL